jgi:hypothetical protein
MANLVLQAVVVVLQKQLLLVRLLQLVELAVQE